NVYGDNYSCTGTDPSPIKYAGMEYDSETQLYHTMFRYYNPRLGLWMTPDPAGMGAVDLADPQSLNRCGYVGNDAVNRFDPFGLADTKCTLTIGGARGLSPKAREQIERIFEKAEVGANFIDGSAGSTGVDLVLNATKAQTNGAPGYTPPGGTTSYINNSVIKSDFKAFKKSPQEFSYDVGLGRVIAHESGNIPIGPAELMGVNVNLMRKHTPDALFAFAPGGSWVLNAKKRAMLLKFWGKFAKKRGGGGGGGGGLG